MIFDPAEYPHEKDVRRALELTVSQVNSGNGAEKADAKFMAICNLYRQEHLPSLEYSTRRSNILSMERSGADLALLLLGAFRSLAHAATEQLADRGFEDFRPAHDFVMRSIAAGTANASELSRRLSISKQAAAKTIALLEERGYVGRGLDTQDARRKRLHLTPRGFEVLRTGEKIFDELRAEWAEQIGKDRLEMVESVLIERLKSIPNGFIEPDWLAQEGDA